MKIPLRSGERPVKSIHDLETGDVVRLTHRDEEFTIHVAGARCERVAVRMLHISGGDENQWVLVRKRDE